MEQSSNRVMLSSMLLYCQPVGIQLRSSSVHFATFSYTLQSHSQDFNMVEAHCYGIGKGAGHFLSNHVAV